MRNGGESWIHELMDPALRKPITGCMRMIAAGKSTREISTELALSVKTISTYRARIFEKMGVRSPAELAAYVIRSRLDE